MRIHIDRYGTNTVVISYNGTNVLIPKDMVRYLVKELIDYIEE